MLLSGHKFVVADFSVAFRKEGVDAASDSLTSFEGKEVAFRKEGVDAAMAMPLSVNRFQEVAFRKEGVDAART